MAIWTIASLLSSETATSEASGNSCCLKLGKKNLLSSSWPSSQRTCVEFRKHKALTLWRCLMTSKMVLKILDFIFFKFMDFLLNFSLKYVCWLDESHALFIFTHCRYIQHLWQCYIRQRDDHDKVYCCFLCLYKWRFWR